MDTKLNLNFVNEDGKLTATFWLLCAVIFVGLYLMIEMLSQEDEPKKATAVPEPNDNHASPVPMKSKKAVPSEEAAK